MRAREVRRWLTARGMHFACATAPLVPSWTMALAERWLRLVGPTFPVLSRMVAANMRAAGVYSPACYRAYFDQVARHLTNAWRVFQAARQPLVVAELARRQVGLDESVERIVAARSSGRGVVLLPPHVCNYLMTLPRLNQDIPLSVYLRWSEDERKLETKRQWCAASGLRVIMEPPGADPMSRAAACVEALRSGAVLVMTPDIAQRRGQGVPVWILGRNAFLPSGPASIAMLAEVPLIPIFGRLAEGRHYICAAEPIEITMLSRAEGGRPEALRRAMQIWAEHFEAFVRNQPEAWFLWADSRWTRVFRGDPKYSGIGSAEI